MLKFFALLLMEVNIIPPHGLLRAMPRNSLGWETLSAEPARGKPSRSAASLQDFSPPEDLWSNHLTNAVTYKKLLLLKPKHLLHQNQPQRI